MLHWYLTYITVNDVLNTHIIIWNIGYGIRIRVNVLNLYITDNDGIYNTISYTINGCLTVCESRYICIRIAYSDRIDRITCKIANRSFNRLCRYVIYILRGYITYISINNVLNIHITIWNIGYTIRIRVNVL